MRLDADAKGEDGSVDAPDFRTSGVSEIAHLDRTELALRWRALTGAAAPKRSTARLLMLALAYELQLRASSEAVATEKAIEKIVERASGGAQSSLARRSPPRRLSVGARLMREWRGKTLIVDVVEGGFDFEGRTYRSLSKIAKIATGVQRNGPSFFGLREREESE